MHLQGRPLCPGRTLLCAAGSAAVADGASADPDALLNCAAWLSLTAEGTPLADASAGGVAAEPLTDWRLVLGAPLVVENLLPVRGSFCVWEQAPVRPALLALLSAGCAWQPPGAA